MDDYLVLGLLAGLLTTVCYVPQIIKGYRTKQLDDISLSMLVVLGFGLVFWTIYGIVLDNLPLILWDIASLALVIGIAWLKLEYRKCK
jgi:MtN3 and saliva related transmembrane protein